MRLTLATVGSRGDVQPMIALAVALRRKGHHPVVAAPPNFEAWVRSHELEFAPLGIDLQAWLADNSHYLSGNPVRMMQGMSRYFGEHLPTQFQSLVDTATGHDAIISAGLAFAVPSVAERLEIPALALALSPSVVPSRHHPPPTLPWHGLPLWMNDLLWRASQVLSGRIIADGLNAGRASIGLPKVSDVATHLYRSLPVVVAADEELFPSGGECRHTNFLYYDDPRPLDRDLVAWLDDGEPPVFVGFGSMSGQGVDRAGSVLIQAIENTGRRVLIGAGWGNWGNAAVPPGWRVVRDVPHAQLFPRVAVVVHHGGAGTTANALRAGVPQVILPLILDQFHHASRLAQLALCPPAVPLEGITAGKLAAVIEAALTLPSEPRTRAATRLRASDGAAEIIAILEQVVGRRTVESRE